MHYITLTFSTCAAVGGIFEFPCLIFPSVNGNPMAFSYVTIGKNHKIVVHRGKSEAGKLKNAPSAELDCMTTFADMILFENQSQC